MRFLWVVCGVAVDLILAAVLYFGHPAELHPGQVVELFLAVPISLFCVGWLASLLSGNVQLLPVLIERMNWRIAAILIATLLSIAATLIGFFCGLQDASAGFIKDIFAAWIGGVAFFGLVGLVVSVVSLSNAAEDSFPVRARVLVRGRTGSHIDDFIERLRTTLAHYAESVTRTLTVTEYDTASGMYLVRVDVETVIRSFVDDIDTTYLSKVSYKPDYPPPANRRNKLIKLTGVESDRTPLAFGTADEISREYQAAVPRGEACIWESALEIWVKAGTEAITYSPIRHSLSTTVRIDNELDRELCLRVRWHDEPLRQETIPLGVGMSSETKPNLKQGSRVHTLFLDPP